MQTELLKGTLATLILKLLADKDRLYGYEITQLVKERSAGRIAIKEGSLYPILHKMQAEGLLESEEEYIGKRLRRYYKITQAGQEKARTQVSQLMAFFDMMQGLLINDTDADYGLA